MKRTERKASEFPLAVAAMVTVLLAITSIVALGASGCHKQSRKRAPLSGKVTYRGQPLRWGTVLVEHGYGQPATARIQPDGTFEFVTRGEGPGVAVGKWRMCVACYEGQDGAGRDFPNQPTTLGQSSIPEKYTDFETSDLAVEVHPGKNQPLAIDLTE